MNPTRSTPFLFRLAILILALGAVSWGMYILIVEQPSRAHRQEVEQSLQRMYFSPVQNKLDPRFADADGDLLADAPAADKQIDPPTLTFCYVAAPEGAEAQYERNWDALVEHLSRTVGRPVKYLNYPNSDAQILALADGSLHISGLNTGSVPIAVDVAGFVPLVRLPGETQMHLIVPASSAFQSVKDLKGGELLLTEPNSNSGFKAPLVILRDRFAMEPERDYRIRLTGSHDASIAAIASGSASAAAVASDLITRAETASSLTPAQYRSIYKSENFPPAALGHCHQLNRELAGKIRQALLSFDWKGTSLEKDLGTARSKFSAVVYKTDWQYIRMIDDTLGRKHALPVRE